MESFKKVFLLLLVPLFLTCANLPVATGPDSAVEIPALPEAEVSELSSVAEIPTPFTPDYLTIIAAGDNLYHQVMIRDGEEGDYETAYSDIRVLVDLADIAFINQETILAGEEFGFSGYPRFNSPQELGRGIAAAGFNVVNHATNHIMDKGEKAVFATLDFWDTIPEVTILGVHRSQEQRSLPKLIIKNNITLGFLSFTYGTNGLPVPKDKPYLVSLINTEIMAEEIDALRPLCDFLVVSMHWGEEYQHTYNKSQENLASFLAEHQVDLVIGHHPHVIQPVEYIPRPDGGVMLCFYSLGNLISAQTQNPTMLGALAYVKIRKEPDGETTGGIEFMDAGAIPVVTHYEGNFTGFKVYPLHAYTEELAEKHRQNRTSKQLTLDYLTGLAARVLGDKEISYNPFVQ